MLAKVISLDVWDADTGEADILAEFENKVKLKAFTLDYFEEDDSYDVVLSVFSKEIKLLDQINESKIYNIDDKYEVEIYGEILDYISNDEDGKYLVLSTSGLEVNAHLDYEDLTLYKKGDLVKIVGRLDIEEVL